MLAAAKGRLLVALLVLRKSIVGGAAFGRLGHRRLHNLGFVAGGGTLARLTAVALATAATAAPTPLAAASMLALGLVCGAIAYLLYFRLVTDIGATGALTVTYLIPVFGVLWGALFLGEAVSLLTLAGAALVILGTVLTLVQPGAGTRQARSAP